MVSLFKIQTLYKKQGWHLLFETMDKYVCNFLLLYNTGVTHSKTKNRQLTGILSSASVFVQIFFPGGQSAPDMPLGFVDIQHFSRLPGQGGIDLQETLCDVFMYRTLTDPKLFCRLPYCRIVVYNVFCDFHSSLLNISFQNFSPANTVFTMYAGKEGVMLI